MKYLAEIAKILLSQYPKHTVEIENIGKDDNGKEINLTIEITREQFENLIKHYIEKTIKLSKKTIEESGINPSAVSKTLLVGGPNANSLCSGAINKRNENSRRQFYEIH